MNKYVSEYLTQMRIIYYYQTFTGLKPILENPRIVDVIQVSSVHFDRSQAETDSKDGSLYIHLNDHVPEDKVFDQLWKETKQASDLGIKIHLMVGGAGGAYQVMFSNFDTCYGLLKATLEKYSWISGIDLDIEEFVSLDDVKKLIRQIRQDFGPYFQITMAPVQEALQQDVPGIGGFVYKDLYNSPEGKEIAWFNVQAYADYSLDAFSQMVDNGYPESQLVFGMISSQFDKSTFKNAIRAVRAIRVKYPKMGGVFDWEYFDAPPGPSPSDWAELMYYLVK